MSRYFKKFPEKNVKFQRMRGINYEEFGTKNIKIWGAKV